MAGEQTEQLAEGTLLSHLVELRSRLFKMVGAVFIVFIALLPFAKQIFNYVAAPLVSVVPNGELLALSPVSPLTATIALTFYIAIFISMPVILYQLWAFVAPGLYLKNASPFRCSRQASSCFTSAWRLLTSSYSR